MLSENTFRALNTIWCLLRQYTNEDLLAKKDEILRETPEHLVDTIGNVLRAFLMKLNLPLEETEELVGKVKEKKMGYLFENMEKIDIQEERRKSAEAVAQAKAEAAEQSIQLQIETCQEVGVARDIALQKVQEKNNLSEEEAIEKMKLYWKE